MALTETAYSSLRALIFDGTLGMGERLLETALADRLQMSRTPVREALQLLLAEGVIEAGPTGLRTKSYSGQQILEIYHCRALLESESVKLTAIAGLSAHARRALEEALEASDALLIEGLGNTAEEEKHFKERFRIYNHAYHNALYEDCPNSALRRLTQQVADLPAPIRNFFSFSLEQIEESHRAHKQIFNAIVSGDSDRAAAHTREHIWTARDRMNPAAFMMDAALA